MSKQEKGILLKLDKSLWNTFHDKHGRNSLDRLRELIRIDIETDSKESKKLEIDRIIRELEKLKEST